MRWAFAVDPKFYRFALRRSINGARSLVQAYRKALRLPSRLGYLRLRDDLRLDDPARVILGEDVALGKGVIFGVEPGVAATDPARFAIGDRVYLEDGVELGVAPGALLSIGDDTSIHRGCVILGNVRIGRHCVFSYNVYAAAGTHVIDARAGWLIKDQDDSFGRDHNRGVQTTIEDDVWIGWGVFIASGVTVGRGAVVGANAVVTADVEPYAVVAGAPARKIGARLPFAPPHALRAASDEHLPYFYRGFATDQAALARSRRESVVWAVRSPAVIALPHGPFGEIVVRGRASGLATRFALDGVPCAEHQLPAGEFELHLRPPQGARALSASFRALEMSFDEGKGARLGIAELSVAQAPSQAHSKAS
jgi:acetyltransferase-like isoleucine patch superfamily enzyme